MSKRSVFVSNRTQAVRLPADARFPIRSVPNGYTESQRKVFPVHETVFNKRLTVAGCTPKRCVVSAAGFVPV